MNEENVRKLANRVILFTIILYSFYSIILNKNQFPIEKENLLKNFTVFFFIYLSVFILFLKNTVNIKISSLTFTFLTSVFFITTVITAMFNFDIVFNVQDINIAKLKNLYIHLFIAIIPFHLLSYSLIINSKIRK